MKADDLISSIPQKTFAQVFEEKEKLLEELGINKDNIAGKRNEYSRIFLLDQIVKDLSDLIKNYPDYEFSNNEVTRISFYFAKIRELAGWIHNLDLSNPNQLANVFRNFDNNINNSGYLKLVEMRVGGRDIPDRRSLVDMYIDELELISRFFKLSILFNKKDLDELEVSLKSISDNVVNANDIAKSLLENKNNLEEAQKSADNWLSSLDKSINATLEKRSLTFAKKAEEHKTFAKELVSVPFSTRIGFLKNIKQFSYSGKFYWLIIASIFAAIAFGIVLLFIWELRNRSDISLGVALIRISSLIIPSYFAYFCSQQYLNHKKLYEAYNYRDIALTTMKELLRERSRTEEQAEILNKGMNIIFSEPLLGEDNNQKKLVDDLKEIIVKKLSN